MTSVTIILVVGAATSLILLLILELMREIVVLRRDVAMVRTSLGQTGPTVGQSVELDRALEPPGDTLVLAFLSRTCSSSAPIEAAATRLSREMPELRSRFIVLNRDTPSADSGNGMEFGRAYPAAVSPALFDAVGVIATPTLVLLERDTREWKISDLTMGPDVEWFESRVGGRRHEDVLVR